MPRRPSKDNPPTFEEALAELEQLVEAMEEDQLPLETLVEHYERGSRLLARCETVLKSARDRLELITVEGAAEAAEEAETPGAASAPDDAADHRDDDEIRLF